MAKFIKFCRFKIKFMKCVNIRRLNSLIDQYNKSHVRAILDN